MIYLSGILVNEIDESASKKAKCAAAHIHRVNVAKGKTDGIRRYSMLEWPSDVIEQIADRSVYTSKQKDVDKFVQGRAHFDRQLKNVVDLLTTFKTANDEIYKIPHDEDINCKECDDDSPCRVQRLKTYKTSTNDADRPSVPCATKNFEALQTFVVSEIFYVS